MLLALKKSVLILTDSVSTKAPTLKSAPEPVNAVTTFATELDVRPVTSVVLPDA